MGRDYKMLDNEKFNKNLFKYNLNANIQKNIAKELIELVCLSAGNRFNKVFEIGCGSGFLTEKIYSNLKYKKLILNDIVENSEGYVKNFSNNFICGDIEKIIIPNKLNLIISSSVFQWLKNFENFVKKIYDSLDDGGIFAFSMFINENFKEIDILGNCLKYLDNNYILELLEKNFNILFFKEKKTVLKFNNSIEILQHIKNTGVNVINKKKLEKSKVQKFIESGNLNLTYNYNFVIVGKNVS